MPVRAAARNQSKEIRECSDALCIFCIVTRMSHFHSVESFFHQRLESLAPAFPAGVRPYRQRSGRMRDRNCFGDFESRLGNKTRTTCGEKTIECFLGISNVPAFNHRACNVRAPDCPSLGLFEHCIDVDLHAKAMELIDNFSRACYTSIAKFDEL